MNSSTCSGSPRRGGVQLPSINVLRSSFHQPKSSALRPSCDRPVVSFAVYKAQRRRAAIAAEANARRRGLINAVVSVFVVASFLVAGYTLHQEQRLQQTEHRP